MAVEWVDPDTLTQVAGTVARAADFNSVLQDLKYMYDPPRCTVRLNSAQTVANATDHTITWSAAVWDSHGDMWDVGAPSVITITRAGVYIFNLRTLWGTTSSGGKRAAFLHVNGVRRADFYQHSADGVNPFASANSVITNLAVADSVDVDVRQLSGAALNLEATRTVLSVVWIAAAPVSGE